MCYHRVNTRLSVPYALGIPTNVLDKPFPELRLMQRGLDKLATCCCASFFRSSVLKAGSLPPHPLRYTSAFWHCCQFLGPPRSLLALSLSIRESGPVARNPGTGCMFARMQSKWSVEYQGIHKLVQSIRQLDAEVLEPWKSRRNEPPSHQHQEL